MMTPVHHGRPASHPARPAMTRCCTGATVVGVTTAGLRELRQNASELVRQAEAGAVITVSVSGRAVAELGPAHRDRWRSWSDVAAIFAGPGDPDWEDDREQVDQAPHDPSAP